MDGSSSNPTHGRGRYQSSRGRGRGRESNMKSNSSQCRICKKFGHDSKECRFRCRRCRNPNHSDRDCYYKDRDEDRNANFSEENEDKQVFYSCMIAEQSYENTWYVDSGCSNHMTGNK